MKENGSTAHGWGLDEEDNTRNKCIVTGVKEIDITSIFGDFKVTIENKVIKDNLSDFLKNLNVEFIKAKNTIITHIDKTIETLTANLNNLKKEISETTIEGYGSFIQREVRGLKKNQEICTGTAHDEQVARIKLLYKNAKADVKNTMEAMAEELNQ